MWENILISVAQEMMLEEELEKISGWLLKWIKGKKKWEKNSQERPVLYLDVVAVDCRTKTALV